jgi:hypothetical protein
VVATVAVVVVLFVALQPDAAGDGSSPTPSTPTGAISASPPTTPGPSPERRTIEVTYSDGAVQGPSRFTVTRGETVRILVRADVSDHVHLHGYDIMADVAPGGPARIDFVANVAGVFEVELEDAGRLLFNLEVSLP